MSPALFALVILEIRSHFLLRPGLDHSPIYASLIAGMTGAHDYHTQFLLLEMGCLMNFLPGLASNSDSLTLCLPSSWDYRREPLASGSKVSVLQDKTFWRPFS
jgi:hypothetical protein